MLTIIPLGIRTKPWISIDGRTKMWSLEHECIYKFKDEFDDFRFEVTIPKDFEFDLASIPRFFWRFVAPFELSIAAPLIHDYLYRYQGKIPSKYISDDHIFTRKQADKIFLHLMIDEGVPNWKAKIAYRAVRIFGRRAWNKHKKGSSK